MIRVTNKVDGRKVHINQEKIVSIVACPDGIGSIIETVIPNWVCPVIEDVETLLEMLDAEVFAANDDEDEEDDLEDDYEEDEEDEEGGIDETFVHDTMLP